MFSDFMMIYYIWKYFILVILLDFIDIKVVIFNCEQAYDCLFYLCFVLHHFIFKIVVDFI
jgi:hypothetical protein